MHVAFLGWWLSVLSSMPAGANGRWETKLGPWVKEEGITDQSRLVFMLIGVDGSLTPGHLLSWVDWTAALPQGVC